MDEMLKDGMQDPRTPEDQMQMMMKMMVQQAKSSDKLYNMNGVEEEQLNNSIVQLNLQNDPEFVHLVNANMQKVMMKAQQAQGGRPGGAPPGMGMGMPF